MDNLATKDQLVVKGMSEKLPMDAGTVLFDFLMALSGEMYSSDMMSFVLDGTKERLLQRGHKPEDVDKAIKVIVTVLLNKRTQFTQDFMG